jgi:mannose-1-phosphate guanylyltransferase
LDKVQAVLLVGGLGTRLRPLTNDRPKSIVPVVNRPVLEHTLAYLKQFGIKDIVITLNYLPEVIEEYFGDGSKFGVNLTYFMEQEPRGTAGAVKNAESYLEGKFFVLNGDVFTDMDLNEMMNYHRKKKAKATIALTRVENPSAFGVVETNNKGRVQKFIEKPPAGTETTNWINAGTYILERDVLDTIPSNVHHMFENGVFPHLVNTGQPVFGYPYGGYWLDMGNPAHYYTINMDMMNEKLPCLTTKNLGNKPIYNKKGVILGSKVRIEAPAIIEDGCIIGSGVNIKGRVAIGKNCRINDNATLESSIIWDGVTIGANAKVKGCIISSGTLIADSQQVENSIITHAQTLPLSKPAGEKK